MKRARLVQVDWFTFKDRLKKAGLAGTRIEPTEKDRWRVYVKEHAISEAAAATIAEGQSSGKCGTAIIDDESDWGGYYIFSADDVLCFRFEFEDLTT